MKTTAAQIAKIASTHLGLGTLEERKSDRLDFHEFGVLQIKAALEAAYSAGFAESVALAREAKSKRK